MLSRKNNESIMIGKDIRIEVIQCEDGKVRLGIDAPPHVKVYREELFNLIKEENREANKFQMSDIIKLREL